MTVAVILNLTAVIALLIILAKTMRLPYRLPIARGARPRRTGRSAEPSTPRTAVLRRAEPELETT
jgi:hypothetical protein